LYALAVVIRMRRRLAVLLAISASTAQATPPITTVVFGAPSVRECPSPVRLERMIDGRRERLEVALVDCDGAVSSDARRALSAFLGSQGDLEVHPALMERLQRLSEAFPDHPIEILSGVRLQSPITSRHRYARAVDLRVIGVPLDQVRDLLRSIPQTGVGVYPAQGFVHLDVREHSAYWDAGADRMPTAQAGH
jgi:hypothetical protein